MRRLLSVLMLSAALLPAASPAFAHARLRASAPAVDATVASPAEVSITFSESLEPRFSTIEVTDAAGVRVDQGDLHLVGGDAKIVAIGLKALPNGKYTVLWHATSVDTHKTEGTFTFTVAK